MNKFQVAIEIGIDESVVSPEMLESHVRAIVECSLRGVDISVTTIVTTEVDENESPKSEGYEEGKQAQKATRRRRWPTSPFA